jgi:tRNA threonylcarbamoyladenosine biosynthesis protein TsaB
MMLLAIDTTSAVATAALFRDGSLVEEHAADASKKHAETALPLIDELLEANGVSIGEIDVFAVDIGPGSFKGVRIGVSLVNALAFATGKRIVPVNALRALYEASGEREQPVCALIDARNKNVYAALYQAGREVIAPEGVELDAFLERVPADAVFVGDIHAANNTYPSAKDVGRAALCRLDTAQDVVEPLYLRPSQAERLKKPAGEA